MTAQTTDRSVSAATGAVVFTDLVGFTEFTALRGDEAALSLLSIQEEIVRNEIEPAGRVVKELGDGLMLWFDDSCQAVSAAIALQENFDEHSAREELPLWVRIGIHYGRPARRGSDLIGHDVNVASRIVDLAGPGEVLVSESAVRSTGGELQGVEFEEVGPVVVKGIPDPIGIYRAVATG
jgi:adenylate cyclase